MNRNVRRHLMLGLLGVIVASVPARQLIAGEHRVVHRSEWGARPASADISKWTDYGLGTPAYTRIVLHITSRGQHAGNREMRAIQNFHMDQRAFSDIGYNYLIDSAGRIYEGRDLAHVPAHAGRTREADSRHDIRLDPDFGSIGIVFSADPEDRLTPAQTEAAIWLIRELRQSHPVSMLITHTEVRRWITDQGLTPHTQFLPQVCPGAGSIDEIIHIRQQSGLPFLEAQYRGLFEPP